jgi:hypothetical protein
LWFDLTFDNDTEVTKKLNVARTTWNYKYYVSGLGTPYKSEHALMSGATLVLEAATATAKDTVDGNATEMQKKSEKAGLEALRKYARHEKGVGKELSDVLKKATGMSASGWRANWHAFVNQRRNAASAVSRKEAARALRLAKKHAGDAFDGAKKGGVSLMKHLAKGLAKEVAKASVWAALDSTEMADIEGVARALRSGYKKRINGAWEALSAAIKKEKDNIKPPGMTCCGKVHVYIFGAEWGGTLARIFANKIVSECESKNGQLWLGEIPVHIRFVGLFDCANSVTNKRDGEAMLGRVLPQNPITMSLDDTELPAEVEAALHLYSTHERGYLLSSLAGSEAKWQAEQGLPGISADVCGGRLLKGEYGLAQLEIAKYALCQMHACARFHGAPFAQPDDGTPQAEELEKALRSTFLLNEEDIHTLMPRYLQATGTADAEPEEALQRATEAYVKWLRMLYDESDAGRRLDELLVSSPGEKSSEFMAAMKRQVRAARPEAERGRQLVGKAMEHRLGAVWESGEHLDDLFLSQFLVAYTHFNSPSLPLSFREIEG